MMSHFISHKLFVHNAFKLTFFLIWMLNLSCLPHRASHEKHSMLFIGSAVAKTAPLCLIARTGPQIERCPGSYAKGLAGCGDGVGGTESEIPTESCGAGS